MKRLINIMLILCIFFVCGWEYAPGKTSSRSKYNPNKNYTIPTLPGYGSNNNNLTNYNTDATPTGTLIIHNTNNSSYVKLVDTRTSKTVVSFTVGPNEVRSVQVPEGNYYLRYRTGDTYMQANREFSFSSSTEWSVTLYKTVGGNLGTRKISPKNF